jgi:hypothetical protein
MYLYPMDGNIHVSGLLNGWHLQNRIFIAAPFVPCGVAVRSCRASPLDKNFHEPYYY